MNYRTNFYLDSRVDKNSEKPSNKNERTVRFSFTFDKMRFMSTTGLKADERHWSKTQQRFKCNASNADEKNKVLDNISKKLEKIYLDAIFDGKAITPGLIRDKYRSNGQEKTFFNYFDEFTLTAGRMSAWSYPTYQKFKTIREHLENFQKEERRVLDFTHIDREFYQKLFTYFVKLGHRNSTIIKNLKNANWFLAWVIRNKKIPIPGFKDFELKDKTLSAKTNPANIVFLKPEEFLQMYNSVIPDQRLTKVKDIFVFMCATGLRFSDYYALRPDDIIGNNIHLTTQKTDDTLDIPLNPFSRAILEKYKYNLPKISNVKMNEYLKELGSLLLFNRRITKVYIKAGKLVREEQEISKVLSTHCARRTFISLSVFLNMNSEIIMQFSGHKDHKTMQVYMGITDEQKRQEMSLFSPKNLKKKLGIKSKPLSGEFRNRH